MTGWPDETRPGVPLNPETPDWHAVLADDTGFAALRWSGKVWHLGPVSLPPEMLAKATYLGRLCTPAEVASQLAAARREGAEEMRERAAALLESEANALSEWARAHPELAEAEPDYWHEQHARHLRAVGMADAIRALAVEGESDAG